MYRLVLYYLLGLLVSAGVLGYLGLIPYNPLALILSTIYIGFSCWLTNLIFSRVWKVPTNIESLYITALILVFIITPLKSFSDPSFYILAGWASIIAMASKYILAIRKKHIFNPAAIAVVITAFVLGQSASWWIGTAWMFIPVLVGGLLLTRKLIRTDLVVSFLIVSILLVIFFHFSDLTSIWIAGERFLLSSPAFFFAFLMLTEPLTTPPTKVLRIIYGAMVGLLFVPAVHIGSFYFTPELALIIGNIFVYIVSPKEKLVLRLKELKEIGRDTYDFIFTPDSKFNFKAGQYLEWTLAHVHSDSRGNRRYFTLASSPTENSARIGVKFYPEMSSFKKKLLSLKPGDTLVASQRAGEFTLPKDKNKKLVFLAGGIGITPFRSMLKHLIDKKEKRDIVMFYSNKVLEDVAYTEIFDQAEEELGVRTVYTLTDTATLPNPWLGERGFITAEMIKKYVPDYRERYFYISGPHMMVTAFEETLQSMGLSKSQIKTDFFPGFV